MLNIIRLLPTPLLLTTYYSLTSHYTLLHTTTPHYLSLTTAYLPLITTDYVISTFQVLAVGAVWPDIVSGSYLDFETKLLPPSAPQVLAVSSVKCAVRSEQ